MTGQTRPCSATVQVEKQTGPDLNAAPTNSQKAFGVGGAQTSSLILLRFGATTTLIWNHRSL